MNLSTGTRLGPYEILSPIGAGGMGEVFRARDTRLDRSVAIKVLPSSLARDAQFRLRLEREAKTISQLNHPHICTLFDIGHEKGTDYLVMELIEGESLAERLAKGPLPLDHVVRYGAQIAAALDRAHQQGVVHRDLKPGNIMITKSGAKLLDFGLARSHGSAAGAQGADAATQYKPITEQGTVIGTYQYMAPEQLEGLEADARTDIFALGAVLYEMATGRRAFEGKSRTSLIAAIVSSEPPPISHVQPLMPGALEHVVRRCLAKDPDERWQSARDVAIELQWIGESGSQAEEATPAARRILPRERAIWLAAIIAAIAITAALVAARRDQRPSAVNYRFEVPTLGADHRYGGGPSLSPDGSTLLYAAENMNGGVQLVLRRFDETTTRLVEGSAPLGNAWGFSRDGKNIAFVAGGKLRRAPVAGGAAQVVADGGGRGLAYGDGFILLGSISEGIKKVSIADGKSETITKPDGKHALGHLMPRLLPDGEHFLFITFGPHPNGPQHHDLYVASVRTGEAKLLGEFPSAVEYGGGYLYYVRDGVAMARAFDPEQRVITGDPVTVAENVRVHAVIGAIAVSATTDGTLALQAIPRWHQLVLVSDRGERIRTIGDRERFDSTLHVTPDGEQLLTARADPKTGTADVVLYGIERPTIERATFDVTTDFYPLLSRDGSTLYYASDKRGVPDIYQRAADGTGAETLLVEAPGDQDPLDVSPTAPLLLYQSSQQGSFDLYVVPLDGGEPRPVVASPGADRDGRFSPDGEMIAYQSDVSGRAEIYVKPVTGQRAARQISTGGGSGPRWSKDGRAIYFLGPDDHSILAASRTTNGYADPRVVFKNDKKVATFEVLPANRFVVMEQDPITGSEPIRVIVRWQETIQR